MAKKKSTSKRVVKLAPERPEARDEGPRLIPLDIKTPPNQFGRRALELADVALGLIPPRSKKPKKKS
jgi:hypothetical protein